LLGRRGVKHKDTKDTKEIKKKLATEDTEFTERKTKTAAFLSSVSSVSSVANFLLISFSSLHSKQARAGLWITARRSLARLDYLSA